jgi:hypothetical protein
MAEVFDLTRSDWSYRAEVPAILRTTALPLPAATAAATLPCRLAARSAAWWADATKGQNFDAEDQLDTAKFNRALWRGMVADRAACRRSSR